MLHSMSFWSLFQGLVLNVQGAPLPSSVDFGGLGHISTGANDMGAFVNNLVLWLVGVSAFITGLFIVVNGIKLMTAMGDQNKIKEGMDGMKQAIFGFLLALLAAGIVKLIDNML